MNIFTTFAHNLQERIIQNQNRKTRAEAVRSALFAVTRRHLEYQATGFDQALFNNQAAALIDPFINEGVLPNADTLAVIWAMQFNISTKGTRQAIANVMPMINDFIYILETGNQPVGTQPAPTTAPITSTVPDTSMMPSNYAPNLQLELSS